MLVVALAIKKPELSAGAINANPRIKDKKNLVCFAFCHTDCDFISCLIDVKCPNKTTGTINVGNQLNRKFKIEMFGWSNANFCKGEGADNKAFTTIFIKSARQIKFQPKIICRLNFPFVSPK